MRLVNIPVREICAADGHNETRRLGIVLVRIYDRVAHKCRSTSPYASNQNGRFEASGDFPTNFLKQRALLTDDFVSKYVSEQLIEVLDKGVMQ